MTEREYRQDFVIRFSVLHRFLHLVVMIGFTGLAATGLSLGFSSTALAAPFFRGHHLFMCRGACVVVPLLQDGVVGKTFRPAFHRPLRKGSQRFHSELGLFFRPQGSPPTFRQIHLYGKIGLLGPFYRDEHHGGNRTGAVVSGVLHPLFTGIFCQHRPGAALFRSHTGGCGQIFYSYWVGPFSPRSLSGRHKHLYRQKIARENHGRTPGRMVGHQRIRRFVR
jgi:hypothetical protein